MPSRWDLVLFALGMGIGACVSGTQTGTTTPPDIEPLTWNGSVAFEARDPTPTGASSRRRWLPARHVELHAVSASGEVVARAKTDAEGNFQLVADTRAQHLKVVAHLREGEWDLAVTTDSGGERDHEITVPLGDAATPLQVRVDDSHQEAGALHILDAIWRGARAVQDWMGRSLPPFYVYWSRGVTTNWSFYNGDRGTGRYSIELLGGEPGQQATTDTDEHDEMIVLHEFGHFVMDVLSSDSSYGGQHPRGFLIMPGLAWEEARATWFATMVLRNPRYQDTIGIEPSGQLRVNHDLERGDQRDVRGIGSESGVAEILWDLADGDGTIPDTDQDGVALGPAGMLAAMVELGRLPGAHPAIPTFLRHLVRTERASVTEIKRVLEQGGHPPVMLPENDQSMWPVDLPIPGVVADKIDGLSNPAPSGGPPRPTNGQDAIDVYRIHVEQPTRIRARLEIFGSGAAADHTDLDLELRDIRSELLSSSRGEGQFETVSHRLEPGWYTLHVRDGGNGNRVGYELRVNR